MGSAVDHRRNLIQEGSEAVPVKEFTRVNRNPAGFPLQPVGREHKKTRSGQAFNHIPSQPPSRPGHEDLR